MKLIAKTGFRNTHPNDIVLEKSQDNFDPDLQHVHKGARFTIGGETTFDKLQRMDKRLFGLAVALMAAKVADDASNEKVCKIVDEEVALAKKQEREAAKTTAAAGSSKDLANQLLSMFQELKSGKSTAATAPAA